MDRRRRLEHARLYLVCDARPSEWLHAVLAGGVDLVQLRMKSAPDADIMRAGRRFRQVCSEHDALLIVNDRPDLAAELEADGVHVGQDDVSVPEAREAVGPERLVGQSTHSPEQIEAALGVNYIGVGPVFETPTKPGRPPVGLELVGYAATHSTVPFFAIGGISPANVMAVREAGAGRVAVVRALTDAPAPEAAARQLREALGGHPRERGPRRTQEACVGTT